MGTRPDGTYEAFSDQATDVEPVDISGGDHTFVGEVKGLIVAVGGDVVMTINGDDKTVTLPAGQFSIAGITVIKQSGTDATGITGLISANA